MTRLGVRRSEPDPAQPGPAGDAADRLRPTPEGRSYRTTLVGERPGGSGWRSLLPLAGALLLIACGDEPAFLVVEDEQCFERRDGRRICIETYEASRQDATADDPGVSAEPPRSTPGRLPWTDLTWAAARAACQAKGKRLCDRDEWIDACDGGVGEDEGTIYPYGNALDPTICNVSGIGPEPGGQSEGCVSDFGVFDLSGNVWEWTGNTPATAVARGGGFRSTQTHACTSGDQTRRFDPNEANVEVGFRCCRDG